MRRILIVLGLVLWFAEGGRMEARVGETEAELVQRFGVVQRRRPERTLEQGCVYVLGERVVFKQREWRVTAVLIQGRCAKITYAKKGAWTDQQFTTLLATNSGRWTWSEIIGGAPKWQRTWRRADGLVAKWMYAGGFVIEAQPLVDARERIREMAGQATAQTAAR